MTDNTRRHDDDPPEPSRIGPAADPFSLEAYLARQHEEFDRNGPTMAEVLADMDRYRAGSTPRETAAEALHAVRSEREEHLDSLWRK